MGGSDDEIDDETEEGEEEDEEEAYKKAQLNLEAEKEAIMANKSMIAEVRNVKGSGHYW